MIVFAFAWESIFIVLSLLFKRIWRVVLGYILWEGRCCIYFVQNWQNFQVLNVDLFVGSWFLILGSPLTDWREMSYLFIVVACLVMSSLTFAIVRHFPSTVATYLYGLLLATCVELFGCVTVHWTFVQYRWCCWFATGSIAFLYANCCSVLLFMNLTSFRTISIDFATAMTSVRSMYFWMMVVCSFSEMVQTKCALSV